VTANLVTRRNQWRSIQTVAVAFAPLHTHSLEDAFANLIQKHV